MALFATNTPLADVHLLQHEAILLHLSTLTSPPRLHFFIVSIVSSLYENPGTITTAPPDPQNFAAMPYFLAIYTSLPRLVPTLIMRRFGPVSPPSASSPHMARRPSKLASMHAFISSSFRACSALRKRSGSSAIVA